MGWVSVEDRFPEKKYKYQQKTNLRVKYTVFADNKFNVVTATDYFFNGNKKTGRKPGFKNIGYKITHWYEEEK